MTDTRHKDCLWRLMDNGEPKADGSRSYQNTTIQLALLMDIRDELKRLNSLLHCTNFLGIPNQLRRIRLNTNKKKRKVR